VPRARLTVASFYYPQWGINIADNAVRDLNVKLTKSAADAPDRQNFISAERIPRWTPAS
jgi:hypothetical protein